VNGEKVQLTGKVKFHSCWWHNRGFFINITMLVL